MELFDILCKKSFVVSFVFPWYVWNDILHAERNCTKCLIIIQQPKKSNFQDNIPPKSGCTCHLWCFVPPHAPHRSNCWQKKPVLCHLIHILLESCYEHFNDLTNLHDYQYCFWEISSSLDACYLQDQNAKLLTKDPFHLLRLFPRALLYIDQHS